MVRPDREKILQRLLEGRNLELSRIAARSVIRWEKCLHERRGIGVHGHLTLCWNAGCHAVRRERVCRGPLEGARENPFDRVCRRHIISGRAPQSLLDSLIVAKNERLILLNRSAGRGPILIASKRRNHSGVKEVPSVQGVVAKKFIGGSMELVCSRLGNRTDNAAGGASVFGGIVRRQDRKLRHSVCA